MNDTKHPSHVTRISMDASIYDEICINCGATDVTGGGWGSLAEPCPAVPKPAEEHAQKDPLELALSAMEAAMPAPARAIAAVRAVLDCKKDKRTLTKERFEEIKAVAYSPAGYCFVSCFTEQAFSDLFDHACATIEKPKLAREDEK